MSPEHELVSCVRLFLSGGGAQQRDAVVAIETFAWCLLHCFKGRAASLSNATAQPTYSVVHNTSVSQHTSESIPQATLKAVLGGGVSGRGRGGSTHREGSG